jgi:hypothetical protein
MGAGDVDRLARELAGMSARPATPPGAEPPA